MGTKSTSSKTPETEALAASLAGLEHMNAAVTDGMKQMRALFETGVKSWEKEAGGFLEKMSADSAQAWRDLSRCKSPLEMLSVEQAWLATRAKAYMEAGQKLAEAIKTPAKAQGEGGETPPPA